VTKTLSSSSDFKSEGIKLEVFLNSTTDRNDNIIDRLHHTHYKEISIGQSISRITCSMTRKFETDSKRNKSKSIFTRLKEKILTVDEIRPTTQALNLSLDRNPLNKHL
jgi:hypothetical protein